MEETSPLLRYASPTYIEHPLPKSPQNETTTVNFDPDGDPDNPLDWSRSYRWGIVGLLACMAFTV
jgi:hypothetical protein